MTSPAPGSSYSRLFHNRNFMALWIGQMISFIIVGMVVGPSLAGFSIGLYSERVAFVANSLGFVISALAVLTIRSPKPSSDQVFQPASLAAVRRDLGEGIAFLFGSRTLVGIMICNCILMLGIGAIAVVWVPYLQSRFGVGATGLGIVDSAQGIGMVFGGALLGFIASRTTKKVMVAVGSLLIGMIISSSGLLFLWMVEEPREQVSNAPRAVEEMGLDMTQES